MPSQSPTKNRVEDLHTRFVDGATLRELGDVEGLSHERIRQLFEKHGLSTKRPAKPEKDNREQIWGLYKKHGTIEDVVSKSHLSRGEVSTAVNEMPLRQIYRRKGKSASYTPEYIVECLRAAARVCGEPLTIPSYRLEAPTHGWPADLTVVRHFGSWHDACQEAGVEANAKEGPRKGAKTAEECLSALRMYSNSHDGEIPSYEAYVKWARENQQPSGPTVRAKVGPWREALIKAFD